MNDFDDIDILLVEDNEIDAEMTMRALGTVDRANRLYWVKDGVEALDFVRCTGAFEQRDRHHDLKLVLLDIKLARLGGLGVLREMKADPRTRKIPVVMLTSSDQDPEVAETYGLEVNAFVTKPVQSAEFRSVIASIATFWLATNRAPTP